MSVGYVIIVSMIPPTITDLKIALENLNESLQKKIEQNIDTPEDHEWVRLTQIELDKEIDRLGK